MTGATTQSGSSARRTLLTVCAMSATIMQALDTTIANVALPYMQGSLSASLDQINWVLTSYIVASAVMTAPIGWMSNRFGRKKLFIICVAGFTVASLLCATAQNIDQMVLYRLLQGMCGAALVPLSQALMLDSYSMEQRGQAMAIWGMGVMLGPIMGPTLGAWLTDNYSWHWVFLINLPVGIVTVLGLLAFMDETEHQTHLRFDWFGFIALSVGIGSLQLMLDRGEQLGWFGSSEIIAETIISVAGFYFFFAHSLTTDNPFIRFELFKDRSFVGAVIFMVVIGLVLYATMALVTPYMQNVLGYPILTSGFLLGARGIGTLFSMMAVGRLLRFIEARTLVGVGMLLTAGTLYQMVGFNQDTAAHTIVTVSIVQGVGLGLVFVPLSTVAFMTLAGHLRTEGSAMLTLVRNIGSSVGISIVIANLTSKTTVMHERLGEYVTPFNNALQMPDVANTLQLGTEAGKALLDQIVTLQANVIAYSNDFVLLMWLTLATIPLLLIIGTSKSRTPVRSVREGVPPKDEPVHALD
jgi:DHA2 family multidrug resistance protein